MDLEGEIINVLSDGVRNAQSLTNKGNVSGNPSELFEARVMLPGENEPPVESNRITPEERAQGLIRGVKFILNHHCAPKKVIESFNTQALLYLVVPEEKVFFKRAKYLTVSFMSQYLNNSETGACEPPKVPDKPFISVGSWRNWSKTRLRVFNRRNTHLWYSILQSKRSALPLSSDLVLTTYEEHRAAMGVEDPIDIELLDETMEGLEPVLDRIQRSVLRAYDTDLSNDVVDIREASHVASSSACFEASRDDGGQLGYLASLVPELEYCNPSWATSKFVPELVRMAFYPKVIIGGKVRTNVYIEEFEYSNGERLWRDAILGETLRIKEGQRLKCTIQAVLEPLKVRVISKGEAVPYYVSKRLQKTLHDVMRKMNCFRLIGKPLCPTHLVDLHKERSDGGSGDFKWFSIDYSAATDRLSAALSKAILTRITEGHDATLRNVWLSVLAPHWCRYPFPFNDVEPIDQVNGQLMGSILSFPILCLANLGLYLLNLKKSGDTRTLQRKLNGVLVNGDDMLYVARSSMWKSHVELGERMGLTMSPGKAYMHSKYANANSACFHYDLSDKNATPWAIPFLNSGLYFGQNKVMGSRGDSDDGAGTFQCCAVIEKLLDGTLPGKQAEVLKPFLKKNKKIIQSETDHWKALGIPISLGGMGVNLPVGWRERLTGVQLMVASAIVANSPYGVYGQGPVPAPEIPSAPVALKASWLPIKETEDGPGCANLSKHELIRLRHAAANVRWLVKSGRKVPDVIRVVDSYKMLRHCDLPSIPEPTNPVDFSGRCGTGLLLRAWEDAHDKFEYVAETTENLAWLASFQ